MAAPLLTFTQIGKRVARRTRRAWTNTVHAEGIRQSINDAMDRMSRHAAWPFRMTDLTLSLGTPGSSGTRYIALPDGFSYIDPDAMRSTAYTRPLIYVDYAFIIRETGDPTWAENGNPSHWGTHGRNFFFWPRISATWVTAGGAIYCAYSAMFKHVAESGTAADSTEYGDTDNPDCPAHYHEALVIGATAYELEVRFGPGGGERAMAQYDAFLARMAGKTDVIGGGGSAFIRHSRRNLVGSAFR